MYAVLPALVLGFHGCDESVADAVVAGRAHLKASNNAFDWLGGGIYFWENSPARALRYATELHDRPRKRGPKISRPAVVGAVIEMGYCLNLLDVGFLDLVRDTHQDLRTSHASAGVPMPRNRLVGGDLLRRDLDCAVLNLLHTQRQDEGLPAFDTVRAAFAEGGPLYPDSGFTAKHHIQLCVRRRSCIKGYFRPMDEAALPTS